MQLVSVGQSTAQSLSIGGVAGRYDGDTTAGKDGLGVFIEELIAAAEDALIQGGPRFVFK